MISLLEEQEGITDKGGTMRLGHYPCKIKPGTLAANCFGEDLIQERHRHRWEFNNAYQKQLEDAGLTISGSSPDGTLAEIGEIAGHPFMLGTQFHPELQSRPNRPHPLFAGLVGAVLNIKKAAEATSTPERKD